MIWSQIVRNHQKKMEKNMIWPNKKTHLNFRKNPPWPPQLPAQEPVLEMGLNGLNDPRILGHTLPQGLRFGPEKPSGEVHGAAKTAVLCLFLEDMFVYIYIYTISFLSYYQHKLAGASRSQRVQMLANGYRY